MDDKTLKNFDPAAFLSRAGVRKKVVELEADDFFFVQGDPADSVYLLVQGRAKLSVISGKGKQATIKLLSPADFFGEEALTLGATRRVSTAAAVNTCTALKIGRDDMTRMMHGEPEFADWFMSYLLVRSMRTQADLVDQIFNTSEKRLARTLLLMAEGSKSNEPQPMIPPITQEALAEMVGTTRSRVSYFMNRFRTLGLISYTDRIRVHRPRLEAAMQDQFA